MTENPFITERDIRNFEGRMEIAALQNAELDAAIAACGPGAIAYGVWVIRDRAKIEPDKRSYCCRRPDVLGWKPQPEHNMERMTPEMHAGYDFKGDKFYPFRWSLHFQACEEYHPVEPEKLAERRAKRESRKIESQLEELRLESKESLFPEMYDDDLESAENALQQIQAMLNQ